MMIIAFLAISLPVWALKPMEDAVLSTVSGPDSLGMKTPERARLVLSKPVKKDPFKGIGHSLLEVAGEFCDAALYGEESPQGGKSWPRWTMRWSLYSPTQNYRGKFTNTSDLESDQAKGKFDPNIANMDHADDRYSLSEPIGSNHSIYYLFGSYRRSDEPVSWVSKPYGGPEMRTHYLNDASTAVQPKSWVDIKPH